MTGRDLGLQYVLTLRAAQLFDMRERREATSDEKLVPVCAVLIEEQDGLSRRAHTRPGTRRLDFHERDKTVDLRLLRCELGQDAPESQRLFAERRPHPVLTGGR